VINYLVYKMAVLNQVKKIFRENIFLLSGSLSLGILVLLYSINNLEQFYGIKNILPPFAPPTFLILIVFVISFLPLINDLIKKKNNWTTFFFNFFWLVTPANLILLFTSNTPNSFNPIIPISSIFLFLLFLNFLVFYYLKLNLVFPKISFLIKSPTKPRLKKPFYSKAILLVLILALHLFFGFYKLGQDYYSDEDLWFFNRIEKYWNNLAEKDWLNTRPSDKPGITVSIISGAGLPWEDPNYFDKGQKNTEELPRFFTRMRAPIVVFSTLAILAFFFLLNPLIGKIPALLATIFIGLSPLLLGISRLVNPDALLWIFLPLSFFAYLAFLLSSRNKNKFLIYSGILLGLALLTKYIANFLIVFIFLVILYQALFKTNNLQTLHSFLKKSWLNYLSWLVIALSIFTLLYPGVWLKHDRLLIGTIKSQAFGNFGWIFTGVLVLFLLETFLLRNRISFLLFKFLKPLKNHFSTFVWLWSGAAFLLLLSSVYFALPSVNFNSILISPKSSYREFSFAGMYLASFLPLVFGLNLFSFLGVIFSFFFNSPWKKNYSDSEKRILLFSWLFIHGYYLASLSASVVPSLRYQIALLPIILIIAALGWKPVLEKIIVYRSNKTGKVFILIFLFLIAVESTSMLWLQKPYYFSFNNPLLPSSMVINPKDMGEGNYEVAMWLNQQPNASELSLWSDRTGICKFFVGNCNDTRRIEKIIPEIPTYDFYVISSSRENYFVNLINQRLAKVPTYIPRVDRLYDPNLQPVFLFSPAQRPQAQYIKVIKAEDVCIDK